MLLTTSPSLTPSGVPTLHFIVPDDERAVLDDAVNRGARAGHDWRAAHPSGTRDEFVAHVVALVAPPSDDGAIARDIAAERAAMRARTPALDAEAAWVDSRNSFKRWSQLVENVLVGQASDDAVRGARMMTTAQRVADRLATQLKINVGRPRPFLDAMTGVTLVPGIVNVKSSSFPSAHTAFAAASAEVTAALDPTTAATVRDLVIQTAHARVYAGAHYVSDVVAGAFIGAAAGAYALDGGT